MLLTAGGFHGNKSFRKAEKNMRVFISADIEGVAGVTAWSETRSGGKGYEWACRQMTAEVRAACEAAVSAGCEVVVKDGHEDAMNIDPEALPRGVRLIRGWQTSPAAMMGGLDESFSAVLYIGYHAPEGTAGSPLAHTIEHSLFNWIRVNGVLASEFSMNALWAAGYGVPSVFLSGDGEICRSAQSFYPGIVTVAVKECVGDSACSIHPLDAQERIYDGVRAALNRKAPVVPLESSYEMEISFKEHQKARAAGWYPGARQLDSNTVSYTAATPREMILARMFMTGV